MSTQYAGTPTGTGPALPQYLSDADIQAAYERALCDVDSLADLKALARSTRLATEKMVKAEKDNRRAEKVMAARSEFDKHVARLQLDIKGVRLIVPAPDFGGAIKGLSSLASIDEKLTAALIAGKAEANTIVGRITNNLRTRTIVHRVNASETALGPSKLKRESFHKISKELK